MIINKRPSQIIQTPEKVRSGNLSGYYRGDFRGYPSYLFPLPNGVEGTRETLRQMVYIVKKEKSNPEIINLARDLCRHLKQKDWLGQIRACTYFVRDKIRYIKDINGIETLSYPVPTLRSGQGDCDDKCVLLASLLESIGHPCRFMAIGFAPNQFSHVLVQTKIGAKKWINCETTEPVEIGWQPKGVKCIIIAKTFN